MNQSMSSTNPISEASNKWWFTSSTTRLSWSRSQHWTTVKYCLVPKHWLYMENPKRMLIGVMGNWWIAYRPKAISWGFSCPGWRTWGFTWLLHGGSAVRIIDNVVLAANNCHITAYLKNIIYLDSVQLSASELEEIKKKISPATTFAVCFRDCRNASAYDQHLAEYITNVIEHHSHKWKDFSAKAEMSTRGDAVFITAPDQKTRFALKNSCKKFIQ